MRALSKMTLRMGQVSIPVKVFSAFEAPPTVEFNLLHDCGTKLAQEYRCPKDGAVVPRGEALRGYEHEPGRFLVLTAEEIAACGPSRTGDLKIDGFIGVFGNPDPLLYEHPYYLCPDKGAERAYSLLAATILRSGYKASGFWCLRGKEQPVVVYAHKSGVLIVVTRRYEEELLAPESIGHVHIEPTAEERSLCLTLIKGMALTRNTVPVYKDRRQDRLRGLIAKKALNNPTILDTMRQTIAAAAEAHADDAETVLPAARYEKKR